MTRKRGSADEAPTGTDRAGVDLQDVGKTTVAGESILAPGAPPNGRVVSVRVGAEAVGVNAGGGKVALEKAGERENAVPAETDAGAKVTATLGTNALCRVVYGERGRNLGLVEKLFDVEIYARGNELTLVGAGAAVDEALDLLHELYDLAAAGHKVGPREVRQAAGDMAGRGDQSLAELYGRTILVSSRGRPIRPKGLAQARYVSSIQERDIVFGVGPAGTGKTYLAMAMAVRFLQEKRVARVILTRPAVEAGEKLGFLPGGMMEKVNPYLRPLYDALNDMMEPGRMHDLIDEGVIEVAPLAFMRGRTLNDSFVVLDEAQNTTSEQMKMFLTRLGYGSKAVITGDVTQIDLPGGKTSGLVEAQRVLSGVEGIAFRTFSDHDVVRHPLVQRIIKAYEAVHASGRQSRRKPRQVPGHGEDSRRDPGGTDGRSDPVPGDDFS